MSHVLASYWLLTTRYKDLFCHSRRLLGHYAIKHLRIFRDMPILKLQYKIHVGSAETDFGTETAQLGVCQKSSCDKLFLYGGFYIYDMAGKQIASLFSSFFNSRML